MVQRERPTIFHFNCPLCGAHPKEKDLFSFITFWRNSSRIEVLELLRLYLSVLSVLETSNKIFAVKRRKLLIRKEIQYIKTILSSNHLMLGNDKNFIISNNGIFATQICALCKVSEGKRPDDKYFSLWELANKVQIANLFYELGIIFFGIASGLPSWCENKDFIFFKDFLEMSRQIQESLVLVECSYCRRFTNCLYGEGKPKNPYRCRWCLDRAGGVGISIKFAKSDLNNLIEVIRNDDDYDDVMQAIKKNEIIERLSSCIGMNHGIPKERLPETLIPGPQNNPSGNI